MPKLSVIMGCYNAAETLPAALDSLLCQSFDDFEIVVCDDGSTDTSSVVLAEYAAKDARVKILTNTSNRGLAFSLNRCIDTSSSELLLRQDADDVSLPSRLERLYQLISDRPDVTVLGTSSELYAEGKVWGTLAFPQEPSSAEWMRGSQLIHPSVIMRKADILEVGGYDPLALRVEDIDLWYRLLLAGKRLNNCNESLYRFTWGRGDYGRKRFVDRWREARLRSKYFTQLGLPVLRYIYIIKPLVAGLVPSAWLYYWHRRRFEDQGSGK